MTNVSQTTRTKKAIVRAFISLLKEKPFEKIIIQDILNATPVTRATFYSYFHDKHEIIEELHTHFFKVREKVRNDLKECAPEQAQSIICDATIANRDLLDALLKIRTEEIDLKKSITSDLENHYLQTTNSDRPSRYTEAKIYAQARTEAYLAFLYDPQMDFSLEYINDMYLSVALRLLKLSDDQETIDFLKEKLKL